MKHFRQLLTDLYKRNYISVDQCNIADKKEILNAYLETLGRERSHEIFVDADREGLLPQLFKSWLLGIGSAESFCDYILQSANDFYADEMDDELENVINECKADKEEQLRSERAELIQLIKYGT
jgi:hypothetical protein